MFLLCLLGCLALPVYAQGPQYDNAGRPYNAQNSVYDQNVPYAQQGPQYQQPPQGPLYNQDPQYNPQPNIPRIYSNDGLNNDIFYDLKCPEHWVRLYQSCYRFIRSPLRPYEEARRICEAYSPEDGRSDLVSIGSTEEHGFLINQLNALDPQHRRWYIGTYQHSANYWTNVDGSQLVNMENAFLPVAEPYGKDHLAYNFSVELMHWGFQTYTYGVEITNPEQIPRGPYFIKQPVDATFDSSKKMLYNDISLSCLAGGFPTPTYEWFREDYEIDKLVARRIDPLSDPRYTISGGMLIIHEPEEKRDHATYHCKASNKFGTIISESVQLNFGFIKEFVLKRSPESGDKNWGKAIYCDPPNHFPSVRYSWSRDYFPNFVEEDRRVFVSYDGALYFSALETIDKANYSCSVQSEFSDSGRNGPFFPLMVNPHSHYQQLKFPNNFPKAFPDAPIAGKEVRLECMAFGYPVPSYNWTRRGAPLPRSAVLSSFNRVLTIPHVQVEDQGEYVCRAYNDRASTENSLILNIQAEPNFTIPLADRHADSKSELVWTCEAFGIPDVNYTWWKNGRQLVMGYMEPEERDRIRIQDNVLTIRYLDQERDPGMYQCRATNSLKTKYSSAQLRVLAFRPTFKKHPLEAETYAAEGGSVTIKCNPEAAPRPEFVWKKDGNVLGSGGHRRILENGNLVISSVSRDDEGQYTCRASNQFGVDESKGRLIVLRGPRLIESLTPKIVTTVGRYFDLRCLAETEEMLDIAYVWSHNGIKIRDIDIKNMNYRLRIDGGFLSVTNATFTDAGEYECTIKSTVGKISSRSVVVVEGPPGPPGGVTVSIQKSSFTLQWTDGATHGSQIRGYTVSGRTNWNQTWVNISYIVDVREIDRYTGQKESLIDTALTPWSTYEFRIAAWNSWGMGPPSAPSPRHSTPPDRPYIAPYNIGGGGGKIGDLTITWSPLKPDEQNGPGIYYRIFWKRKDQEVEFQTQELKEFGNTGMAVVHIPPQYYYTEYIVKVQAINQIGPGPISPEHVIYSAEDMPQVAPQLVVARSFNSTALNVSWVPIDQTREKVRGKLIGHRVMVWRYVQPSLEEEPLKGYKIRVWEFDQDISTANDTIKPFGGKLEAYVNNLQPGKTYRMRVLAYSNGGDGRMSSPEVKFRMGGFSNSPLAYYRSACEDLKPFTITIVIACLLHYLLTT
nr:PREDICTED: contactin [Tribolium castaneum]|eukprot:XP_008193513.1 PREDICTED: contactin [Tribolium castaneum]